MFIIEKPEIIEKQKEIVKYHQLLISTESLLTSSFIAFHAFYFSVSAFVIFSTYHIGFLLVVSFSSSLYIVDINFLSIYNL